MEAERRHTADLEAKNAELEVFVRVASHDLRQPLTTVLMLLDLADLDIATGHHERLTDRVKRVRWANQRAIKLLEDPLAYAHADGRSLTQEPVDLGLLLEGTLRDIEGTIRSADAIVQTGPLPRVRGDATLLGQLFANLVGNATKYRSPTRPCRVHVSASRLEEKGWRLSVVDNGIGIPVEARDRVFVPFERADDRADSPQGTGLGLAFCHRVVERHGGRIWVDEGVEGGTSIHFTLPDA